MNKCQQWVQPKDRWSSERQCSRNEKEDTGLCSVHLKMLVKPHMDDFSILILEQSDYDPRFTMVINEKMIVDYNKGFPEAFHHRYMFQPAHALAHKISHMGANAPAVWDWLRTQPRRYNTIGDMNTVMNDLALQWEKSHTEWSLKHNEAWVDYDLQIEKYGLDTMSHPDYEDLMAEYQEYMKEKRAYDNDVQKIVGEFRDEQTKFITDLRERQRKELAGLIVPTSPLE